MTVKSAVFECGFVGGAV